MNTGDTDNSVKSEKKRRQQKNFGKKCVGCCLKSPLSQHAKAILSPWKGCDRKERSVVREL